MLFAITWMSYKNWLQVFWKLEMPALVNRSMGICRYLMTLNEIKAPVSTGVHEFRATTALG